MRFLVDENLPRTIASLAEEAGFEATWVGDVLHGEPDGVILRRLRNAGEVLVTRDERFANMGGSNMAAPVAYHGVVLIREQSPEWMRRVWQSFLKNPGDLAGLIALTRKGVRRHHFR